jgi:hypothetical protein
LFLDRLPNLAIRRDAVHSESEDDPTYALERELEDMLAIVDRLHAGLGGAWWPASPKLYVSIGTSFILPHSAQERSYSRTSV